MSAPAGAPAVVDLAGLPFDQGAHLLVRRALAGLQPGERLAVAGHDPALLAHLRAWCRTTGHRVHPGAEQGSPVRAVIVRGPAELDRWATALRAGGPSPLEIVRHPDPGWGLAARGALIEDGAPAPGFDLAERDLVWADVAPSLYAHAAAAQWDPATAVPWDTPSNWHPPSRRRWCR